MKAMAAMKRKKASKKQRKWLWLRRGAESGGVSWPRHPAYCRRKAWLMKCQRYQLAVYSAAAINGCQPAAAAKKKSKWLGGVARREAAKAGEKAKRRKQLAPRKPVIIFAAARLALNGLAAEKWRRRKRRRRKRRWRRIAKAGVK
jgi:hypothetical protein